MPISLTIRGFKKIEICRKICLMPSKVYLMINSDDKTMAKIVKESVIL